MKLKLLRNRFNELFTTGQLYLDDQFFCFSLEDKVREPQSRLSDSGGEHGVAVEKWKIDHETAIPRGVYKVGFEHSKRFGPDTLTLYDVPGFTDIRIHSGNTAADTSGCILVGYKLSKEGLIIPGSTRGCLADLKVNLKSHSDIKIQVL